MCGNSVDERYEELKERLGYYILLQAYTFIDISGRGDIPAAMRRLVEKASEINVKEAKRLPEHEYSEFLGRSLAKHMGNAFSSKYRTEGDKDNFSVIMEECGCLGCILRSSHTFNIGERDCKAIFCGACLGGYRLSAEKLGLKFEGYLTEDGCKMTFCSAGKSSI